MVRFHVLSTRIPATTASDLNISSSVRPPLEDRHVCLDRSQLGQSVRELPDIPILPCEALISPFGPCSMGDVGALRVLCSPACLRWCLQAHAVSGYVRGRFCRDGGWIVVALTCGVKVP